MTQLVYKYRLLLLIVLLAGCKKSLDLTPKDQISDASFWKKPADFQLAANDFYYALKTVPQYIDINSDISFGNGANSVSNGSYIAPVESELWNNAYKGIRSTNYLLAKAAGSELGAEIDRWIGEALFFRAYHYWNLVVTYGGVPLIDTVISVTSEALYTERSSQAEIIGFMLNDLDEAAAKLPVQSELTENELGRVTRGAALALKARAALYMATWAKYHAEGNPDAHFDAAIEAAEDVVNSNEYDLFTERGADSYKYLFQLPGDDSREVILARRYYINRATHNWTRELWFNAMVPTKNLADMYLNKDGLPIDKSPLFQGYNTMTSEFANRDPRMSMTFIVPGSEIFFEQEIWQPTFPGFLGNNATRTGYMLRKFLDETKDATQFIGQYDFKEFRFAEVLLILAEALYEKNGSISDADLDRTINRLRSRAGMPALTNAFVTANSLNMLTEIRRERTVELAFEGYRRDDLRRWKMAETILPQAILGVKFKGTEFEIRYPDVNPPVNGSGFIVAEPSTSRQFQPKHYLDPIPLQQIQLSKGTLEQNEGW